MASAILPALKNKYPNSRLIWLAEPVAASLLKGHPLIDKLIVLPRDEWKSMWKKKQYIRCFKAVSAFVKALKREDIDLAIDAQGLLKSGLWAWFSGAQQRVGLGSKEGSQYLMTELVERLPDDPEICSEYRDLANYLKLDTQQFFMSMPVDAADIKASQQTLIEHGLEPNLPYIVICPFTTRAQKHWIDQHWHTLFNQYLAKQPAQTVVLGGTGDLEPSKTLLEGIKQPEKIINMVGKTSLKQAAALIKNAQLLIGVDTGLTHMGIAQQTPTLAIFGSTFPYKITNSPTAKVLYEQQECAPCRRKPSCQGAFTCMWQVTPEYVWLNAQQWLLGQTAKLSISEL
ncbi:glycosyltransferase family 9 protein [Catenovulum sediminis]|uniref:Glycosyltransferase family 9 protein n=1 Tax=Catenovulum sediminis TaxID=1740262 RepID=A0ABV1RG39_9ALTE